MQLLPASVTDQVLSLFAAAKWGKGWRAKVFPPGVRGQTWGARSSSRIPSIDKVLYEDGERVECVRGAGPLYRRPRWKWWFKRTG